MEAREDARDFFISYRSADQSWAEWIAWELEAAGYSVFVQAWDFRPGQNFVHQMQQGASSCRRTIAVLTPAYFESGFTRAEWYSAFARDPTGEAGLLLPIRVEPGDIDGLLGQIIYIDFVGLEEPRARARLLAGVQGTRARPSQPPRFPGPGRLGESSKPAFPGPPPLPPPSAEDRRGLLILLNRVKQFWIEGVLEQSVQHEALIDLGKEADLDAVEHPWAQVMELPNAATQHLASHTKIADVFEGVGRLLLILGEPGAGKTITLLELARDLVAVAHQSSDIRQPVPVVFNLSSWNERFTSLVDWLTEELNSKYRIPKRFGRRWLEANRLVLLLDGLDEVQADRRVACIRAINTFLTDQGTTGLVVCSRLTEYTAEPVRLKMNGAICLQPLTAIQIETYLSRLSSQLDALRAALNKDDVLRDLAKSPLMLSVMTLAYQGASINALAGNAIETPEARRRQVFNTYIDRMFARRGRAAGSAHATEQTTTWLSWLAHNMRRHGQSIFLITQMQPSWLDTLRQIFIYLLSSRLATTAAIWAALSLSAVVQILHMGWSDYNSEVRPVTPSSWTMLYVAQILTFLLGIFCSCSIDLSRYNVERHLSMHRIFRNVVKNPFLVVVANILGWSAIATFIDMLFLSEQQVIVWQVITISVTWGLIFGILSCTRSVSRDIRIHDRLIWSWTGPITISILTFIVMAFFFFLGSRGLIVEDTAKFLFGLSLLLWPILFFSLRLRSGVRDGKEIINYGITSALVNACRAGLGMLLLFILLVSLRSGALALAPLFLLSTVGFFLSFGGVDVINHYILRLIVYSYGYAPMKWHRLLDHCTKLVFLRRVGGGYIFIHRLLLEHFAAMYEAEHQQKGAKVAVKSGSAVVART